MILHWLSRSSTGAGSATPRFISAVLPALALAGCASYRQVSDTPILVGRPYTILGLTYVPAASPHFDQVGYASWYGNESGDRTARGEKFRAGGISAAHTTLPLPTYGEVTALETGRTILVRVNDRDPFAKGRLIDLSRGAAEMLGIRAQGHAPVRVRRVEPSEKDRERLRKGKPASARASLTGPELESQRRRLPGRR